MIAKTFACTIERRLLVNDRIGPEDVAPLLPAGEGAPVLAARAA